MQCMDYWSTTGNAFHEFICVCLRVEVSLGGEVDAHRTCCLGLQSTYESERGWHSGM
jgi:hypothetical protein